MPGGPAGSPLTAAVAPSRGTVHVANYGAKGDGVSDDARAIQAAHDAMPPTGGLLLLPTGRYLASSKLTFTKRVFFSGSGTLEDQTATSPCIVTWGR